MRDDSGAHLTLFSTAPNILTLLRICIAPFLVVAVLQASYGLAFALFMAAGLTDALDGALARILKQRSMLGQYLDPIADKLLVSAALISLVQERVIAGWLVVLLVGREFAVSGLRSIAAAEGYTIRASELGKTKTVSQVVAISLLMVSIRHTWFSGLATLSLYVVVLFSIWSAVSYFTKFWRKVDIHTKQRRRQELLVAERQRRRELLAERKEALRLRRKARREARGEGLAARNAERSPAVADLPPSA